MTDIVPVVMYHNVRRPGLPPAVDALAFDLNAFKAHLDELCRYQTITLDELYRWKQGEIQFTHNSIVLTFDDGYLDNWLIVHPELEKRGMCATLYVNPEFIRPDDNVTPTRSDAAGYLSWGELRAMSASGVWSIQSHTLTHNFRFMTSQVIDFHRPGNDYYWLFWLEYPSRKPYWMTDNWSTRIPYGRPIYKYDRALAGRVYGENLEARNELERYVALHGGATFFENADWRAELFALIKNYPPGKVESVEQLRERVRYELTESKRLIEEQIGQPVRHLCWPGGAYRSEWANLALTLGYRTYTLSSRDDGENIRGSHPEQIKRMAFSNHLGLWAHLPCATRLAVRAKLGSTQNSHKWRAIHAVARRVGR